MIESANSSVFAVIFKAFAAILAMSTGIDVGSDSNMVPNFEGMDATPNCFHDPHNLMSALLVRTNRTLIT